MENQSLQVYLEQKKQLIDQALHSSLTEIQEKSSLYAAISYGLFSGGKRIRPVLLIAACEGFQVSLEKAMVPACALECIHTYSLIHDDLPCMDNSDTRRGKPTVHKLYGEDMALLAGDALLTHAFSLLTSSRASEFIAAPIIVKLVDELSRKSGVFGMVEGQAFELLQQQNTLSEDLLYYIDEHKTAALFSSALSMAAILAETSPETIQTYNRIGQLFGHAFQIADDIQDYETDQNRTNYVHLHGMEHSRQKCQQFLSEAKTLIQAQPYQHNRILELFSLLEREK